MRTSSVLLAVFSVVALLPACSMEGPEQSCEPGWTLDGTECFQVCGDDDEHCDPALACVDGLCKPVPGGECVADEDCPAPAPCTTFEGCQRGVCAAPPCGTGYECVDGACTLRLGIGESCLGASGSCEPGLRCENGVCCDASAERCCQSAYECDFSLGCDPQVFSCHTGCEDGDASRCSDPATMTCRANACVPKVGRGAACTYDGDCLTGHCARGAAGGVCCESACDGACMACGADGVCDQVPEADDLCVVDCDAVLSTPCRTYHNPTTGQCAAFGVCKEPGAEVCLSYTDAGAGTSCRPAEGACDADDVCDGRGECPDALAPWGFECRPEKTAADGSTCDLAEVCDGESKACPEVDRFQVEGVACRERDPACPSAAECCDVADACTGSSADCPDARVVTGTVCRPLAGECDVAETCSPQDSTCPADAKRPATELCADPACTTSSYCDGVSDSCPAVAEARGTSCGVCRTCDGGGSCSLKPSSDPACPGTGGTCYPDTCTGLGTCAAKASVGTYCGDESYGTCVSGRCVDYACARECTTAGECASCAPPFGCVADRDCI